MPPYYSGRIKIGPDLWQWINHPAHRRFASKEWVKGQIRWRTWRKEEGKNRYYIPVHDVEGGKLVKIFFTHYPDGTLECPFDHIYANHAHLFG